MSDNTMGGLFFCSMLVGLIAAWLLSGWSGVFGFVLGAGLSLGMLVLSGTWMD